MKFPKLPKIRNPFKKRGETVTDNTRLKEWQNKLQEALNDWDINRFDELEWLYRGTHEVYGNINDTSSTTTRKKANNVINICYEFIESQVDSSTPQPAVISKIDGYEEQAQMIEDSIKNDLLDSDISEINDENERNTPVCGHSILLVDWDSDYKHPLYVGRLIIRGIHPKQFVPQPNVWKVQDMEYFFILSSVTASYCKRRYGVDVPQDGEEFPEINSLANTGYSTGGEKDKVTEVVCWYRDKEGKYGRFVWANDTILEDMPNYFARRPAVCKDCGGAMDVNGTCIQCGGTRFERKIQQMEVLAEDITLPDGTIVPAGTEIPYYEPKRYPVIVRRNVPKNFTFGGQSDIEVIKDQADAIKKVISSIEEKIIRGGAIIKASNDHHFTLTNELYQIIRGNQAQLAALGVQNMNADINAELAFAREQYKAAQSALGITDSYQGKQDPTAKSGVAKQIQVQQAAGRLQSKVVNKYAAFKELFEIMFEMKLAFSDEPRPYVRQKEDGTREYGEFNRYAFLMQDASGQWYYNTDFMFSSDAGAGLPKDKMFILDKAEGFLREGAFETSPANLRFWSIIDQLHFPGAGDIKKQMQDEIEQQQMQQQQADMQTPPQQPQQPQQGPTMEQIIQQVSQMPPDQAALFLGKLAPEIQQQVIAGLPPQVQQMILQVLQQTQGAPAQMGGM